MLWRVPEYHHLDFKFVPEHTCFGYEEGGDTDETSFDVSFENFKKRIFTVQWFFLIVPIPNKTT